ncbi:MAG: 4Fe-4S dicluster domain-containing protein [Candidatus Hodarchaeales archaeon]
MSHRCKGCMACIAFCPREILVLTEEMNTKGYHTPRLKDRESSENCSGCMFCQLVCPDFAIFIKEMKRD